MQHPGSDLWTTGVPQIEAHKCWKRVRRSTLGFQLIRDDAAECRNFPQDCGVQRTARLGMVLSGEVNQRVLIKRPDQRGLRSPLLVVWKDGFGNYKVRIDLLNIQILCRVLRFMEV